MMRNHQTCSCSLTASATQSCRARASCYGVSMPGMTHCKDRKASHQPISSPPQACRLPAQTNTTVQDAGCPRVATTESTSLSPLYRCQCRFPGRLCAYPSRCLKLTEEGDFCGPCVSTRLIPQLGQKSSLSCSRNSFSRIGNVVSQGSFRDCLHANADGVCSAKSQRNATRLWVALRTTSVASVL